MVAVVGALLFLAVLVFITVRFVQWLRGTGPFGQSDEARRGVGEQRRALRDEIEHDRWLGEDPRGETRQETAEDRRRRQDPPAETVDLNDAWMAGEAFDPPGPGSDDRPR